MTKETASDRLEAHVTGPKLDRDELLREARAGDEGLIERLTKLEQEQLVHIDDMIARQAADLHWDDERQEAQRVITRQQAAIAINFRDFQALLTALIRPLREGEEVMVVTGLKLEVSMPDEWKNCAHLWEIYGDGGDLGGNRTEVICRKCRCPGEHEDHAWRVVWPTT